MTCFCLSCYVSGGQVFSSDTGQRGDISQSWGQRDDTLLLSKQRGGALLLVPADLWRHTEAPVHHLQVRSNGQDVQLDGKEPPLLCAKG